MADITPAPSLIRSLMNQQMDWATIAGELVDNSLDAGASSVQLDFAEKRLVVTDDGNGCDDIEKMLTIGRHYRTTTTRLGRFGIGLKEAACALSPEMMIVSFHRNVMRQCAVDWETLAKGTSWEIPDPSVQERQGRGTKIVFGRLYRRLPSLQPLAERLGFIFMPALLDGKQIVFHRTNRDPIICTPYRLPKFDGPALEVSAELDGKAISLVAGVVANERENTNPGFIFTHEHRVIQCSALGSKGYGIGGFAAIVRLGRKWELAKHKNGIVRDEEELEDWLFSTCRYLLERARSQTIDTGIEALKSALEDRINAPAEEEHPVKAKRGSPQKTWGAPPPKAREGSAHKEAMDLQPGDKAMRRKGAPERRKAQRNWTVQWVKSGKRNGLGRVDFAGKAILLNTDNDKVGRWQMEGEQDPLFIVASGLLAVEEASYEESGQGKLLPEKRSIPVRWAEHLAKSLDRARSPASVAAGTEG